MTTTLDSYERFKMIEGCGASNLDFFYALDVSVENRKNIPNDDNIILVNGEEIWSRYNTIFKRSGNRSYVGNPQFYIIEFWKEHKDYDYYWFCEDDILLRNGSYKRFFEEMDKIETDLLLSEYNNKEQYPISDWCWYQYVTEANKMKYPLHYYVQLFRLSNRGCEVISKHFNRNDNIHTECAIPSIIYMRGLGTKFINLETDYKFNVSYMKRNVYVYDLNTFYHPMKCSKETEQIGKIHISLGV